MRSLPARPGLLRRVGASLSGKRNARLRTQGPERTGEAFAPARLYRSLRSPTAYSLPLAERCLCAGRASRVPFAGPAADATESMAHHDPPTFRPGASPARRSSRRLRPSTSRDVQPRPTPPGRRILRKNRLQRRKRRAPPGESRESRVSGGVYDSRQVSPFSSFYLESDTPPFTLDSLDVPVLPPKFSRFSGSIAGSYVQGGLDAPGRAWTCQAASGWYHA